MAKPPTKPNEPAAKAPAEAAKSKEPTDVKPAGKQTKKAKVFEPGVEG